MVTLETAFSRQAPDDPGDVAAEGVGGDVADGDVLPDRRGAVDALDQVRGGLIGRYVDGARRRADPVVVTVDGDHEIDVGHGQVQVAKVLHRAAAAACRFHVNAVLGAIPVAIAHQQRVHPAGGIAANRQAVPGVECAVGDGDVPARGDEVVIAAGDGTIPHQHVQAGELRIGIGRVGHRVDDNGLDGHVRVVAFEYEMGDWRVLQRQWVVCAHSLDQQVGRRVECSGIAAACPRDCSTQISPTNST